MGNSTSRIPRDISSPPHRMPLRPRFHYRIFLCVSVYLYSVHIRPSISLVCPSLRPDISKCSSFCPFRSCTCFENLSRTEIRPLVIQPVEVPVVNKKTFRRTHNLPVHRDHFRPFLASIIETNGIEGFVISLGKPVKVIEPVEVILVNKRAFALG